MGAAIEAADGVDASTNQDAPQRGFLARLKSALGTVSLTVDQKSKLEAVEATLYSQTAPIHEARVALRGAIADQVVTGAIDQSALAAPLASVAQAVASAKPAFQTAANALYATLTPTQRNQLVAAMKQQHEAFRGNGHIHGHHAQLKKLAAKLNLTSDQIASIRAAFKGQWGGHLHGEREEKLDAMKLRMQTLAHAFAGPAFDAAALDVGGGIAQMAERGPEHGAKMLSAILPILTTDQRQQLADRIRTKGPLFFE